MTLRSLIEAKSPQLAVYFGLDAGVAHRRLEEKEARAMGAKALQMRTERLREANNVLPRSLSSNSSVASTQ